MRFVDTFGFTMTLGQKVVAHVAVDGVDPFELPAPERLVASKLFGHIQRVPASARRIVAAVVGSRSGTSELFAVMHSYWKALYADITGLRSPTVLVVDASNGLAKQSLDRMLALQPGSFRRLDRSSVAIKRPAGTEVTVSFMSACDPVPSGDFLSVLIDNCDYIRDTHYARNDIDWFVAANKQLAPAGQIILASVPWKEPSLLSLLFKRNWEQPRSALAIHAPTLLMRDTIDNRNMIARERQRDPVNTAREFDAHIAAPDHELWQNAWPPSYRCQPSGRTSKC